MIYVIVILWKTRVCPFI